MPSVILLVFYDLGLGGVQTKIVDIVNFFGRQYPSTTVHLLLRTRSAFDRGYQIKNPKAVIHTYSKDIRSIRGPFFFTLYVLYQCFVINPDAILGFLSPFSLPILLTKIIFFWRKTTIVVNEDNYTSGVLPTYNYQTLNKLGILFLYPLANSIIVPTEAVQQDLLHTFHIPKNTLVIVRNWTSFPISKIASLHPLCDLLYAGRLDKTKRVNLLLVALATLKRLKKNIHLCIVGNGTEKNRLQEYVRTHNLTANVTLFDTAFNIKHMLKQSKIFVFSTQRRGEGFPIAILESMATGIPVLSYDFAGVRETITDGANGYIYKTQSEYIQKCMHLLDNPNARLRLSRNATRTVHIYHSPKNIYDYARLLGYR